MRLIDADWVAERLKEWRNWIAETYGENDDYVLCLDTVLMKLDDAPTADAEPVKHGHWIEVQRIHEKDHTAICECSLCGDTVWVYDGQRAWNYCPNCGAYMGVEDETD